MRRIRLAVISDRTRVACKSSGTALLSLYSRAVSYSLCNGFVSSSTRQLAVPGAGLKYTGNAPEIHRKCTANAPEIHRKCNANAPQTHRKRTANAPHCELHSSQPGAPRLSSIPRPAACLRCRTNPVTSASKSNAPPASCTHRDRMSAPHRDCYERKWARIVSASEVCCIVSASEMCRFADACG